MASWPTTLPSPQLSGYSLTPLDKTVRTNMEVGAARARQRTFTRNDNLGVSWQMTDAQYTAFRAWFDDGTTGIAGGSAWFTVTLAIGTTGMQSVTARFIGAVSAVPFGYLSWTLSGKLEVR